MTLTALPGRAVAGLKTLAATLTLLVVASNASALPFANPNPGGLADDLDGNGYFDTGALGSLAFELFDIIDGSSSFGFFDQADPGTLIPIFEDTDLTGEAAIVDFNNGYVFDAEDAAVQSLFAPMSSIGFYFAGFGTVLYSDPTLNLGGADLMGAFMSTTDDYLSILFYDSPADGTPNLLSWHAINDITPSAVPAPASLALVLLGLGAILRRQR